MTNSLRVSVLGGLLASLFIPFLVSAAEFRTGDQPSTNSGETIVNDVYMAGGNVSSAASIQGDLTLAGGNLLINGPVSADLLAGGGTITVLGEVTGDVRIGGGNIVLQGPVQGDVVVAGGQITMSGSKIGGDVAAAGGAITIDAPVSGTIHAGGGTVRINAPVTGNVIIQAENVTLGPKAKITGKLTYTATNEATMEEGAQVLGGIDFHKREDIRALTKTGLAAFFTVWLLAKVLFTLVGALLIGLAFQRYTLELTRLVVDHPVIEFARGIVYVLTLPIASVLLLATVIGIPFGILGLLIFALTMMFMMVITPVVIGTIAHFYIWKPAKYVVNPYTILLGVAIFLIVDIIPILGPIVKCIAMLIALGAVISMKWMVAKEWR